MLLTVMSLLKPGQLNIIENMSTMRIREWSDLDNIGGGINQNSQEDEKSIIDVEKHGERISGMENIVDRNLIAFYRVKRIRDLYGVCRKSTISPGVKIIES